MFSLAPAVFELAELLKALVDVRVQICACEHRCSFGLSWTENTSEICTDPTTASGGDSHCPAQAQKNGLTDSFSPSQLGPAVVEQQQRHFNGHVLAALCLHCVCSLVKCLSVEVKMKKLACARRARLSLQDGFYLKSLTSSRSAQLVFPSSRSQCFPWTKDNVRQSLLQISGSLSYHEGV